MPMCPQGQGQPWANRAMVGRTRSWGNPNHGSPILQILPMRTSASFPRSPGRGHFHREEKGTLLGEIQQLGGSVLLFSRCFWDITLNGDTHIFSSILKNAKKSITKFTPITYFPCLSQGNTFPLLFSRVRLCATPWTAARQASLSFISQSLLKLMSIESVMPSNHLVLCRPLLLLPLIFPSIRVFSNESALRITFPRRKLLE